MRIEGSYTFNTSSDLLWTLLHDESTIQQVIPGCKYFHLHADGKYHITINLPTGPYAGIYEGIVTCLEEQPQKMIALSLTGSGPEVVIAGDGILLIEESDGKTQLHYQGDVDVAGQTPTRSPRLTRTTANFLLRSFKEGLDHKIREITGEPGETEELFTEALTLERTTPTLGMEDFLAELRRDRWVAATVLLLALFAVLSVLGVVFVSFLVLHWLKRSFWGPKSLPQNKRYDSASQTNLA